MAQSLLFLNKFNMKYIKLMKFSDIVCSRHKENLLPCISRLRRNVHTRTGSKDGIKSIKIGCASGFWGDSPLASTQLIKSGQVDYIVFDYLSEITMSLLTAAQAKKPELGYAPDFVSHAIAPHLEAIKSKGIKIISNAGGINPLGCAEALKQAANKSGIDLKIGVVYGDNLMSSKKCYFGVPDFQSKKPLPKTIHSLNAYLGSGPIVECLNLGADIVVTGRCADSSLVLAPLVHSFGWKWTDFNLLASGSLAGHLIECGAQVTGGIYTDWEDVEGWDRIGFPIAEVLENGDIKITKPPNTGGLITKGTVAEQLLYEIGDPNAYILPDVTCDFSEVRLKEVEDGVEVTGALGKAPTNSLKVCATYLDGYKATAVCCVGGPKSVQKARKVADSLIKRCRNAFSTLNIPDFARTHIQVLGSEDTYGLNACGGDGPREAVLWLSVHHYDKKALDFFSMEIASAGTGAAPGLTSIVGGRPKPNPLLRLHSFLVDKDKINAHYKLNEVEGITPFPPMDEVVDFETYNLTDQPCSEISPNLRKGNQSYPLKTLAFARSGDKGDVCNIGVIARKESYLPYIQQALTKEAVANYFSHLFPEGVSPISCVRRYEVNGICALNFVLYQCLGGGGIASLRSDPQGKALAQMLLDFQITDMPDVDTLG